MKVALREIMDNQNITQYKLSKDTGVTTSAINRLTHGKTTSISFELLDKLCEYFQCEVSDILIPDYKAKDGE